MAEANAVASDSAAPRSGRYTALRLFIRQFTPESTEAHLYADRQDVAIAARRPIVANADPTWNRARFMRDFVCEFSGIRNAVS